MEGSSLTEINLMKRTVTERKATDCNMLVFLNMTVLFLSFYCFVFFLCKNVKKVL